MSDPVEDEIEGNPIFEERTCFETDPVIKYIVRTFSVLAIECIIIQLQRALALRKKGFL